ncbi:unnamed protein product, partial [Ectocarpus sp. 12 AP-2014]
METTMRPANSTIPRKQVYRNQMHKFGVNGLPALVLFKEGNDITRTEGVVPDSNSDIYWVGAALAKEGTVAPHLPHRSRPRMPVPPPLRDGGTPP